MKANGVEAKIKGFRLATSIILVLTVAGATGCRGGDGDRERAMQRRQAANRAPRAPSENKLSPSGGKRMGDSVEAGKRSSYYLSAVDQRSDGSTIQIREVIFPKKQKGYVAAFSDANERPGVVLGVSQLLPGGTNRDVPVKLLFPLQASQKVWPTVMLESNGNEQFDGSEVDPPARVKNGDRDDLVVVLISITKT